MYLTRGARFVAAVAAGIVWTRLCLWLVRLTFVAAW